MSMSYDAFRQKQDREKALQRKKAEDDFRRAHQRDTNEQLMDYLTSECVRIGKRPTQQQVVGYRFLLDRLGNWNKITREAMRLAKSLSGKEERCG